MKNFILPLLLFVLTVTISNAQATWTGGGINDNWNNTDNWSTNMVPTASVDVIVPTGSTVAINSAATAKSIDIQGNAVITKTQALNITNPSTIGVNATINWQGGSLSGGGTLTNNGTINSFDGNWDVAGTSILINNGTMNITGSGDIGIQLNSEINNTSSGTIDFQSNNANILGGGGSPRILSNAGIIKTTFTDPSATALLFGVDFKNNNGTIQVEAGTLNLNNGNVDAIELTDGIYNVSSGAVLNFANVAATLSGILTGNLAGEMNWQGDIRVNSPNTATFDFSGNSTVRWLSGSLIGGGILNNNGIINTGIGNSSVVDTSTLNNNGTFNLIGSGDIGIGINSEINNTITGTIDFQGDGANFLGGGGSPRILSNAGIIKTTFTDPSATALLFGVDFKNNNGTIQVEAGTLNLNNGNVDAIELTDGIYNVSSGAVLNFANVATTVSGTLTGNLAGELNWVGDVRVNSSNTAIFDFSGNSTIRILSGTLFGGGTLTNNSIINTFNGNWSILDTTTLINNDAINITGAGDIFIGTNSVINNSSSGIIALQGESSAIFASGAAPNVLNNAGQLIASAPILANTTAEVNNSGSIEATSGIFWFNGILNQQPNGIVKGIGTIDLPTDANFTNEGTFAPGASPGVLTVIGDFKSSSTSVLEVELDGPTQGTEYDLLAIQGTNVIFDGSVAVTLGFEPTVGDEFVIATTTGTISQCALAPTSTAFFNGMQYDFNVICRNDNEVVLTLENITLEANDFDLNETTITLTPNPVTNLLTITNKSQKELINGQLIDITGKTLATFSLTDMGISKVISLENYSTGMYFIRINSQSSSITKRLIKR